MFSKCHDKSSTGGMRNGPFLNGSSQIAGNDRSAQERDCTSELNGYSDMDSNEEILEDEYDDLKEFENEINQIISDSAMPSTINQEPTDTPVFPIHNWQPYPAQENLWDSTSFPLNGSSKVGIKFCFC